MFRLPRACPNAPPCLPALAQLVCSRGAKRSWVANRARNNGFPLQRAQGALRVWPTPAACTALRTNRKQVSASHTRHEGVSRKRASVCVMPSCQALHFCPPFSHTSALAHLDSHLPSRPFPLRLAVKIALPHSASNAQLTRQGVLTRQKRSHLFPSTSEQTNSPALGIHTALGETHTYVHGSCPTKVNIFFLV